MIVHFEGLDLAGKSTLCRRFIAQAPGEWTLRRNRLVAENPVHDLAERLRLESAASDEVVGEVYWAALLYDLDVWEHPQDDVVQDSTIILRSYAHHAVAGNRDLAARLLVQFKRHPRFDRSFVCTCDREVRLARLARRRPENLAAEDFIVRDDPGLFAEMEQCLVEAARLYFHAEEIDTSNLEESEDVSWLLGRIPGLTGDGAV